MNGRFLFGTNIVWKKGRAIPEYDNWIAAIARSMI